MRSQAEVCGADLVVLLILILAGGRYGRGWGGPGYAYGHFDGVIGLIVLVVVVVLVLRLLGVWV
jgi:hypothetical protein